MGNIIPTPLSTITATTTNSELNNRLRTIDDTYTRSVPLGVILPFSGIISKIPVGYLLCNGSDVSKTEYADLYRIIGDTYGTSTTTTFKIPDLTDRFIYGSSTNANIKGGSDTVTLNQNHLPDHTHPLNGTSASATANGDHNHGGFTDNGDKAGWGTGNVSGERPLYGSSFAGVVNSSIHRHVISSSGTHTHTLSGNTANNIRTAALSSFNIIPPHVKMIYIIKAKHTNFVGSATVSGTYMEQFPINQVRENYQSIGIL